MGAAPMKFQKKNGRQKMKKTMGSAPFLQIHFFRAHDPGIPRRGGGIVSKGGELVHFQRYLFFVIFIFVRVYLNLYFYLYAIFNTI